MDVGSQKRTPRIRCSFCKKKSGGVEPVREWLRELERPVRLAVGSDIERVQWRWPVSKPLVGSLGEGLYEVRTSIDGSIYRVFFCIEGSTMVLPHAFMKKTQKIPNSELEIARKRQKKVKS